VNLFERRDDFGEYVLLSSYHKGPSHDRANIMEIALVTDVDITEAIDKMQNDFWVIEMELQRDGVEVATESFCVLSEKEASDFVRNLTYEQIEETVTGILEVERQQNELDDED